MNTLSRLRHVNVRYPRGGTQQKDWLASAQKSRSQPVFFVLILAAQGLAFLGLKF